MLGRMTSSVLMMIMDGQVHERQLEFKFGLVAMTSKKIPVAFFAYNRPDHTQRALDSLSKCRRIEDCEFHLFSDGPRTDAAHSEVEATRKVLQNWAVSHGAQVIEQPHNLGLAKSIVTGVSDLCARYGRVIVVEDDLVVSPDFLHYMIESLDHYEDDERVMQVGGFTLSAPSGLVTDAFLLPVTTTWGWATWQHAWQRFSWQPVDMEAAKRDGDWRKLFDLNGTCAFSLMLEDRLSGRNDSWGILWWYAVSRCKGLVVYPTQSLVWNGGFDGSGIHCGNDDFLQQDDASNYLHKDLPISLAFPSETKFESAHLSHLEHFFLSKHAGGAAEIDLHGIKRRLRGVAIMLKEKLKHAILDRLRRRAISWLARELESERKRVLDAKACRLDSGSVLLPESEVNNFSGDAGHIRVGKNSYIRGRLLTYGHGGEISIGDWCYIGTRTEIWSMNSIVIGNRVLIAHNVNIHDGTAHSMHPMERHKHFRHIIEKGHPCTASDLPGVNSAPVIIEDDVWISFGVTILSGVRIGRGSVIAAGSIVTKDVPPGVLYRNQISSVIVPLTELGLSGTQPDEFWQ